MLVLNTWPGDREAGDFGLGRTAFKLFREFPDLKKRYWGCHFRGRGYFSTTNGAITEDVVLQYLGKHIKNPSGLSRKVV